MKNSIIIKDLQGGEEPLISELALRAFSGSVSGDITEEGLAVFIDSVSPDALAEQLADENCFFINAWDKDVLAGTIGVREGNHIFLFFVDKKYQKQGIGRALLGRVILKIKERYPGAREVLALIFPEAVPALEKLGFIPAGKQAVLQGIVSLPMKKYISGKF